MPAPAPPAWLHKVAEKPPPAPGLKGGAAGTLPPGGQRRSGHAPGVRDEMDSGVGGDAAHTVPLPSPARTPIHPPVSQTHGMGGRGA